MVNVRSPKPEDYQQWRSLWDGYLTFYQASLDEAVTETLWQRLHDPQHPLQALVAEIDNQLVGLAHFYPHCSSWDIQHSCYLNDLFVSPEQRQQGIAQALFNELQSVAKANQWCDIHWLTQDHNHTARRLYDQLTGGAEGFTSYRIEL